MNTPASPHQWQQPSCRPWPPLAQCPRIPMNIHRPSAEGRPGRSHRHHQKRAVRQANIKVPHQDPHHKRPPPTGGPNPKSRQPGEAKKSHGSLHHGIHHGIQQKQGRRSRRRVQTCRGTHGGDTSAKPEQEMRLLRKTGPHPTRLQTKKERPGAQDQRDTQGGPEPMDVPSSAQGDKHEDQQGKEPRRDCCKHCY